MHFRACRLHFRVCMQLSACLLPAQLNVKGNRLGADGKAAIKEAVRGKEGFTLIIDGDAVRARARGARVGARGSHLSGGQRGGGQCGPGGPGLGWCTPTRRRMTVLDFSTPPCLETKLGGDRPFHTRVSSRQKARQSRKRGGTYTKNEHRTSNMFDVRCSFLLSRIPLFLDCLAFCLHSYLFILFYTKNKNKNKKDTGVDTRQAQGKRSSLVRPSAFQCQSTPPKSLAQ